MVLDSATARAGLTFERYERIGYGRFALHGVRVEQPGVTVQAERIESRQPIAWIFFRETARPTVRVERWRAELTPTAPPKSPEPPENASGWSATVRQFRALARRLERWVPRAEAVEGQVTAAGRSVSVEEIGWEKGALSLRTPLGEARLTTAAAEAIGLEITAPGYDAGLTLSLTETGADGEVRYRENRAPISARFPDRGWMPSEAWLRAESWRVPASDLRLQPYETVVGSLHAIWREAQGEIAVTASASAPGEEASGAAALPVLEGEARLRGDARQVRLETLRATGPGVALTLSEPVEIGRAGNRLGGPARAALSLDFSQQPWLRGARGVLAGETQLRPGADGLPVATFSLRGQSLAYGEIEADSVSLAGELAWPTLTLSQAQVIRGAGEEELSLEGAFEIPARRAQAVRLRARVSGQTLTRWLPDGTEFGNARLEATADGAWPELAHTGNLAVEAARVSPALQPLDLAADWSGNGLRLEPWRLEVSRETTRLEARGTTEAGAVVVTALEARLPQAPPLVLESPLRVGWRPWSASSFVLAGGGARLAGEFTFSPETGGGSGRAEMRGLRSVWLRELLVRPPPEVEIATLDGRAAWTREAPATVSLATRAIWRTPRRAVPLELRAAGDAGGMRVEAARIFSGELPVVEAAGALPLHLYAGGGAALRWEEALPLAVEARTSGDAAFWDELAAPLGITLAEPHAEISLRGTLAKPEGTLALGVRSLRVKRDGASQPWPAFDDFAAEATFDAGALDLTSARVRVEGQPLTARGRLPSGPRGWLALLRGRERLDWTQAEGELRAEEVSLAVLAARLPHLLTPDGRLDLALSLRTGGKWSGHVRVEGAATRPVLPFGALEELSADLALEGDSVRIGAFSARAGNEPFQIEGTVNRIFSANPQVDVSLRGENLPLVRRAGLILRSDLDLKARSDGAVTRVSGAVRLREGLYLADLRTLLPTGSRSPEQRPPFFSVNQAPFAGWELGVRVEGDRFFRVDTPLFRGVVSARFDLLGTLGEPRAVGQATIAEGDVLFPFARFAVRQGAVTLTAADPYEPQLFVTGNARRYGYEVQLELTGTAADPRLAFTSQPPLSSEQALLLVMTGDVPREDFNYSSRQRVQAIGQYLGQGLLGLGGGGESRLSIESGDKISRQGRETYDAEYRLGEAWSLVGEYDEFDAYNLGVKWRAFSDSPKPGKEESDASEEKPE